jgi:hypothetical protein
MLLFIFCSHQQIFTTEASYSPRDFMRSGTELLNLMASVLQLKGRQQIVDKADLLSRERVVDLQMCFVKNIAILLIAVLLTDLENLYSGERWHAKH